MDRAEERYSQAEEFFAGLGAVTLGRARIALAQGELASAVESLATLTERLPPPRISPCSARLLSRPVALPRPKMPSPPWK
ncbi:MAG: hypothetical protein LC739_02290 [Actinobacteria bacterium]|nr:hypothetical protein [Actinomycetota bacterium]